MSVREQLATVLFAFLIAGACLIIGIAFGARSGQSAMSRHACRSACLRVGSEMDSQYGNLCTCKNLRTMRGDYGQMFLRGVDR